MESQGREFGLEMYRQIRTEVSVLLARVESLFRYSLIASASVFAWILTSSFGTTEIAGKKLDFCLRLPQTAVQIGLWIPFAFVVLSGVIVLATYVRLNQMGEFLRRCEQYLGESVLSWELFLSDKKPIFAGVTFLAWLLMLWATHYAAIVGISLTTKLILCSTR